MPGPYIYLPRTMIRIAQRRPLPSCASYLAMTQ